MKKYEKIGWTISGLGLILVFAGLLVPNVNAFIVGVFPLTLSALSTRYFEDLRYKLAKMRKHIAI
jgi:hypothetical protein